MTVSTTSNRISYNGDASSTVFSFPYKFLATSDLKVYVDDVLQTITTDYSVGAPSDTGANVTFVSPPAAGTDNIVIVRDADLLQQAALKSNGKFPAETVEDMVDKVTLIAQRIRDLLTRSFTLSDSDTTSASLTVPTPAANRAIKWSSDGLSIVNSTYDPDEQVGNAAASATAAAASAAAALVSENAAAASYDAFDDRYLGSKASDPTLDNDGNALLQGALYWNTTTKAMRVYGGATWSDVTKNSSFASQSFSGNGATVNFTLTTAPDSANALLVFISGVRQVPTTNYTLSGTTLTFVVAPPSGTNNISTLGVITTTLGNPLAVASGGTGVATLTGLAKGNGTSAFTAAVAGTDYLAPAAIGVTVQAYSANLDEYAAVNPTAAGLALLDDANAAAQRATLGLVIGTDVQAYDAQLADVAGLTPTDNGVIIGNGTNFVVESGATARASLGLAIGTNVQAYSANLTTYATVSPTAAGLALLDDASASAQRTTLGVAIGTNVQAYSANLDEYAAVNPTAAGLALLDDLDAAAQRTTLGLAIGTNVQAYSANLDEYAGVNPTAAGLALLDDLDAAAQRTTLGLGTLATQDGTFSGTSSGTNTGDQNLFSTIAVSGQSNVVADATSDTLTFVAGANVTITTDPTTDTITIASAGAGGGSLVADGDYGDITVSGTGTVWNIDAGVVTTTELGGDITAAGKALLDDADAAAQRTTLGLVIGTDVQAYNANLTTWAGKTAPSGIAVGTTDTQTLTNKTLTDPAIVGTILEGVFTITDGAAFEIDPGNGSVQLITLGASRTPKATNFAAGESITLMVNDGTAYTLTWTDTTFGTGGVIWVGGTAPTLATTGYTVIELWKVSTQVYGVRVGSVA